MKLKRHPLAWAVSLAVVPAAWAADPVELDSVVVSASGLGKQSHEMTMPVAVMEGQELVMRREATAVFLTLSISKGSKC